MKYDFDRIIERRDTDSMKWRKYGEDVIPLWVADMDFPSAEPIVQALHERVDHRVFGYTSRVTELRMASYGNGSDALPIGISRMKPLSSCPGLVTGLNLAFHAYAETPGGVLVQPPVYFHFVRDPVLHGRILDDPPSGPEGGHLRN